MLHGFGDTCTGAYRLDSLYFIIVYHSSLHPESPTHRMHSAPGRTFTFGVSKKLFSFQFGDTIA